MNNPWEIKKEKDMRVFLLDLREKVWQWGDLAHEYVTKALDSGRMPIIILAFPGEWAEGVEWHDVNTSISHHVDHMNLSRGNMVAAFGRAEKGGKQENIPTVAKRFEINYDIPEGYRFILLCEFHREWAGMEPLDPEKHLGSLFRRTFGDDSVGEGGEN